MADKKVFVDTDAGWDDWIALILLLQSEDVDVVGITVNGIGEAHIDPGVQNIVDFIAFLGHPDIPVYTGPLAPISYSNVFPNPFRQSVDEFYGLEVPSSENSPSSEDYRQGLLQAILTYGDDLEVICIGGFTGLRHYQDFPEAVAPKKITAMGGAVNVAGNIKDLFADAYPYNTEGEWNLFIDPVAANQVVNDDLSDFYRSTVIAITPLDASYQVPLTQDIVDQYSDESTPLVSFVFQLLNLKLEEAMAGGYEEYFYDPLAVSVAILGSEIAQRMLVGSFSVVDEFPDEMQDRLGKLEFVGATGKRNFYVSEVNAEAYYGFMSEMVHREIP